MLRDFAEYLLVSFPIDITAQIRLNKYRRLKLKDNAILDAGCGRGQIALALRKKNAEVVGMDFDGPNIQRLNRVVKKLGDKKTTFYCADFTGKQQGLGKRFDAIVCSQVLEHIEDDFSVLKSFNHFLRDGGVLYLDVPNSKNVRNKADKTAPGGHVRAGYSKDDERLFESAGFQIERMEYFTHNMFLRLFNSGYALENRGHRKLGAAFRLLWFGLTYPLCLLDNHLPKGPESSLAVMFVLRKIRDVN